MKCTAHVTYIAPPLISITLNERAHIDNPISCSSAHPKELGFSGKKKKIATWRRKRACTAFLLLYSIAKQTAALAHSAASWPIKHSLSNYSNACHSFLNKFNSKNTIDMNTISPRLSTEECGVYPLNKEAKYVKSPVIVNCAINGVRMSPCHISENLVTARHITHEISYAASRRTSSTIPIEIRAQT